MARSLNASRAKLNAKYVAKVERLWNRKGAAPHWKVGFIAPLRQISSGWDKALIVKHQLRVAKKCSCCGALPGKDAKLLSCPCRLVSYCDVACQKSDWKARHKKDCMNIPDNQARLRDEFESAGSAVVHINSKDPSHDSAQDGYRMLEMLGDKLITYGKIPGNVHGGAVFVIKLSTGLSPHSVCREITIYDEPRELLFKVYPSVPEFEKLLALIAKKGVPGKFSPKLYAFAKRETTTSVRIFVDKVPAQVQPF